MQLVSKTSAARCLITLLSICGAMQPFRTEGATTAPVTRPTTAATTQSTQPTTAPVAVHNRKPRRPDAPKGPFDLIAAASESESAALAIRGVEVDLNGDKSTSVVRGDLPTLTNEISARSDETTKLLAANPSLQLLGTQEQDWISINQTLDAWLRLFQERRTQLDQDRKTLDELDKRWEAEWPVLDYYKQYGSKDGKSLRDTAEATLTSTEAQINKAIGDQRSLGLQTAGLQQAVDGQAAKVKDILFSIRQARNDAFDRLFVRNSPPLWNVPLRSSGDTGLVAQGQDSFALQFEAVTSYIKRRYENAGLHVAALLVLAMGLFRIRNVVGQWAEKDPALKPVTLAFAAPFATALVLAALLSVWIYPNAPRLFWAIVGAVSLIPTVVILRKLIDRRLFPILNALVVFYFLDQLRSIVAVVPVVARFLLLLEMLGGAVLLILFIRSTRHEQTAGGMWTVARFIGWLWTAVFVVSFFCDVIGYDSLANLMGDAALESAYLAVILYACVRVVSSLMIIALRSRPLALLQMVRRHQPMLVARLLTGLYWIASALWILAVLASLSIATVAWDMLKKVLNAQLTAGDAHLSLLPVLEFVLTVWVTVRLSRLLRFVLEEDVYDRLALPGGIPYAISTMVNYAILLVGFFVAISLLGVQMTQLTILASAFTLGIGFGLQNIFNNFVSGIILLFERPVRVGDVIQMDDTVGVVGHIGIRASIIRTADSSEIIVPNGNLISNKVTNWTLSNRQRGLTIPISLGVGAEPCRVIDLLQNVAAAQSMVTRTPQPQAFLTKLGADSFSYELHVWTNNAEQWVKLRSELAVALNAELTKQNIPIK